MRGRTCHSVTGVLTLPLLLKVVPVSVAATEGELVTLPVQGVVVPAGVTRPTRTGAGGLCTLS